MDKAERTGESLKLLQDWGKWLISLETIVCISLWTKLTITSHLLNTAWLMFWASIVVAAILLLYISVVVRRVDDKSADRDMKRVWIPVGLLYACFLGGLGCFAVKVVRLWLPKAPS